MLGASGWAFLAHSSSSYFSVYESQCWEAHRRSIVYPLHWSTPELMANAGGRGKRGQARLLMRSPYTGLVRAQDQDHDE